MYKKYFINFINGYFKSLHDFSLPENYHLHTFIVAKKVGYTKFIAIVNGGVEILKSDPNLKILKEKYGIDVLVLDYKNIFNFILILLNYSIISFRNKVIIYFNSHNNKTYLGIFFSKILSLNNIKNIFMAHTQPKRGGLGNSKLKQFFQDKFLFKFFVDKVRLNNITEKNYLTNNKVNENKLHIVPLVVDEDIFTKIKDYKDRKDVLYFGQLSQKKNVKNILKSIKELKEKYSLKNIKLHTIGKETDYFLEEDVKAMGLQENIIKYGFVPLEDLNLLLNSFLVYTNDSKDEGQCVAVFEAALAGCALCLPNIMSFMDVFKDMALFHDVGDYKKLAENIKYYLDNVDIAEKHNNLAIEMIRKNYNRDVIEDKMSTLFTFN